MFHAALSAIAMFFSTLTAVIIMHPPWFIRAAWIVSILATVLITRGWMVWHYGNKRAAMFRAERDTARAALAEFRVVADHKVRTYRGAAFGETEHALLKKANDREGGKG